MQRTFNMKQAYQAAALFQMQQTFNMQQVFLNAAAVFEEYRHGTL